MKKISNVLFLSILGAATLTGCQNDDKESKEKY
jgi:predicted small secreted protein